MSNTQIAVITGGCAGIGFETAAALAARGVEVLLACRDTAKAERAAARIPKARVVRLDLASQRSVRAAAEEISATCARLDLLVNNAGVMEVPYERTEDGFELTLATNHLGHFALTGLVLDLLLRTLRSRIVTVSSNAHKQGTIALDDLQSERGYDASEAYAQSKLANLLFATELQARLDAIGADTISLAAHPESSSRICGGRALRSSGRSSACPGSVSARATGRVRRCGPRSTRPRRAASTTDRPAGSGTPDARSGWSRAPPRTTRRHAGGSGSCPSG